MADMNCYKCKTWKGCIGKEWYNYGEIRWCPLQVIWILQNKEEFDAGRWPSEHKESQDTGQLHADAGFTRVKLVIAEVKDRLARTDGQGELLITQVEDQRDLSTLSAGARRILMYVKGKDRKKIGFKKWVREVYNQQKTGEKDQLPVLT